MSVFDFETAAQSAEGYHPSTMEVLPKGNYIGKITEITNTQSSGGYPMIKLTLENEMGRQWDNLVISPNEFSLEKLAGLFQSAGLNWPPDFDKGEMDRETGALSDPFVYRLQDRRVGFVVRDEEDNRPEHAGEFRPRVKGYVFIDDVKNPGPIAQPQKQAQPAAGVVDDNGGLAF